MNGGKERARCKEEGCGNVAQRRGICTRHYQIWRDENPDLMVTRGLTCAERFMLYVDKDAPDGCWQWLRTLKETGYGIYWGSIADEPRKSWSAHRYSYTLAHGPIPAGLVLDHLCRNRGCVNPDHLEAVTSQVNQLRGARNRNANGRCKYGHDLTAEDGYHYTIRGWRVCKRCVEFSSKRPRRSRITGEVL